MFSNKFNAFQSFDKLLIENFDWEEALQANLNHQHEMWKSLDKLTRTELLIKNLRVRAVEKCRRIRFLV